MTITTSEQYLNLAADYLYADLILPETNATRPKLRISRGWPKGTRSSAKGRVLGACHPRSHSSDQHNEIFISPAIDDTIQALETLAHELLHASDDCVSGHRGAFKRWATQIGLVGKMTATSAGPELREFLQDFVNENGPMPAHKLDDTQRPKQGTRMLLVSCMDCEFKFRTTATHIRNFAEIPQCPCCNGMLLAPQLNQREYYNMTTTQHTLAPRTFKAMTFKQKRDTRAHMRAAGLDPQNDFTPTQFVAYAKQHGFLLDTTDAAPVDDLTTPHDKAPPETMEETDDDMTMIPAPDLDADDTDDTDADDDDDTDADDDDDDDTDDNPEPEPADRPEADNPMDQMLDDRIESWLNYHQYADEHRLQSFKSKRDIRKLRKQLKKLARDFVSLPAQKPTITVDRDRRHTTVEVEGVMHKQFAKVKTLIEIGQNVYLKGAAGSGKTHMAEQLASVFGLDFYMDGRVDDVFTLTGFKSPDGTYQPTSFYNAFKHGGLYLADEGDRWDPAAFTGLNAATSNGYCSFPEGIVRKHKDFVMILAGNTWATGHDRVYTTAQALDGSSMNRYAKIEIEYDEDLERTIALAHNSAAGPWVTWVQNARKQAKRAKLDLIISPRDSIHGAQMLAAEFTLREVKDMTCCAGLTPDFMAILERA